MRAGPAPAAAGHAPAPGALALFPCSSSGKHGCSGLSSACFFGVQGIFCPEEQEQSLGRIPIRSGGSLSVWGSARLFWALLCVFNTHHSTETSPTSFPARRRLKEPSPGPGEGKCWESSAQRGPALSTKGLCSRDSPGDVAGHGDGKGLLPCPKLPPRPGASQDSILGGQEEQLGVQPSPGGAAGSPSLWPRQDAEAEEEGAEQTLPADRGVEPGRGWMLNKAPFRLRWGRWGPGPVAGCVCREGTGIH